MPVTVKLMDRDLIRIIGSTVATISDYHARKYISEGRAKEVIDPNKKKEEEKSKDGPPEDKTVWSPPEKKAFSTWNSNLNVFPGPKDHLFSQISNL